MWVFLKLGGFSQQFAVGFPDPSAKQVHLSEKPAYVQNMFGSKPASSPADLGVVSQRATDRSHSFEGQALLSSEIECLKSNMAWSVVLLLGLRGFIVQLGIFVYHQSQRVGAAHVLRPPV